MRTLSDAENYPTKLLYSWSLSFDKKSEGTKTGACDQPIRSAPMLSLKQKDTDTNSRRPGNSLRMN
jgi:hypothetical protein